MTLLFLLTLGALFALLVVGWFAFERQRATYAQMFELLERERDAARHEAAVFRRLVLPVYDRAEKSISVGESPTGSPAVGGARVATPATSAHLPPAFPRNLPKYASIAAFPFVSAGSTRPRR
jgi:hypothetical protein